MNSEIAKSLFYYDGNLRWISTRANNAKAGSIAGNVRPDGYVKVRYNGKNYLAHRIVWVLHNGDIPEGKIIDHINRNPSDNRIENLRLTDPAGNLENMTHRNKGCQRGVSFNKKLNKFLVRFQKNGKAYYGGRFDSLNDAHKAADELGRILFGDFYKEIEI